MKTLNDLEKRAISAIRRNENFIYDVAANHGQMVDNVKHMRWFVTAIMQELIDTTKTWSHLKMEE